MSITVSLRYTNSREQTIKRNKMDALPAGATFGAKISQVTKSVLVLFTPVYYLLILMCMCFVVTAMTYIYYDGYDDDLYIS